jgi:hypothetical protein
VHSSAQRKCAAQFWNAFYERDRWRHVGHHSVVVAEAVGVAKHVTVIVTDSILSLDSIFLATSSPDITSPNTA